MFFTILYELEHSNSMYLNQNYICPSLILLTSIDIQSLPKTYSFYIDLSWSMSTGNKVISVDKSSRKNHESTCRKIYKSLSIEFLAEFKKRLIHYPHLPFFVSTNTHLLTNNSEMFLFKLVSLSKQRVERFAHSIKYTH